MAPKQIVRPPLKTPEAEKPSEVKKPAEAEKKAEAHDRRSAAGVAWKKPLPREPDHLLWKRARAENARVVIRLLTGDVIAGLVADSGLYTVMIQSDDGQVLVFKNAIATVHAPFTSSSKESKPDEPPGPTTVPPPPGSATIDPM